MLQSSRPQTQLGRHSSTALPHLSLRSEYVGRNSTHPDPFFCCGIGAFFSQSLWLQLAQFC